MLYMYILISTCCVYTFIIYLSFESSVFIHVVYVYIVIYLSFEGLYLHVIYVYYIYCYLPVVCMHSLLTCLLRGVYLYMLAKVSQSPTSCSCRNLSDLTVNTVPSALNVSNYMKRLIEV